MSDRRGNGYCSLRLPWKCCDVAGNEAIQPMVKTLWQLGGKELRFLGTVEERFHLVEAALDRSTK